MTFRTTVPVEDQMAYRKRLESAEPPLGQVIAENPGIRVSFLDDHLPESQLFASSFYQLVMEPEGVRHLAALLFWTQDNELIAHIGLNRTALQGPFKTTERSLLEDLHPHLSAAIDRVRLFDSRRSMIHMLEKALDHPMEGLILLDSKGRVVFSNPAAMEACAWWRGGRTEALTQSRKSASFILPTEIRNQAELLLERFRKQFDPELPSSPASAKTLQAVCHHPVIKGLQATLNVVVLADQAVPPHVRIRLSRVSKSRKSLPLHLLTPAEHRSARLAANGLRNEAIASHLGVSINTVRAHLRSVFDKLGIDHRGELVSRFDA